MIDRQRRLYHEPGSKLHRVWPVFDAFETFLFAPSTRTGGAGVHVRDYADLKRVMNTVIVALLPCLLWAIYNTGAQHFHAWASLVQAGKLTAAAYTPGWLQALFAPDLAWLASDAGPPLGDCVVFGLQR